jgi:hypothetical protein
VFNVLWGLDMRLLKKTSILIIISLLLALNWIPISSKTIANTTENSILSSVGPIRVGEMYISGKGDPNTAIVSSIAEKDLMISLPREGADVVFYARYIINCEGWNDHGYVTLWVQGAPVKQTDHGVYKQGSLTTMVPHCKRGDTIEWILTSTYYYLTFCPPIIHSDGGAGVCSFPSVSRGVSNTLLFSKILQTLRAKELVIKGTIIFE